MSQDHNNNQLRNQNDNQNDDQMSDPLDDVLLREFNSAEQLRPSSGFALSVMDAIYEEIAVPPPIPFPWKRIVPGAIAIPCALVAFAIWATHHNTASAVSKVTVVFPPLTSPDSVVSWIALSLLLTLIAVLSSFRLANGRAR